VLAMAEVGWIAPHRDDVDKAGMRANAHACTP
jgi:hypothetical protein